VVIVLARLWTDPFRRLAPAVLVVAAAAAILFAGRAPASDLAPGDAAAMEWIRVHARPLDHVCASAVPAARWIPALAQRPSNVSVWRGWPAASAPCTVLLALSGVDAGRNPPQPPAFRAGAAAVWMTTQDR
jgi:hypothetical protein